LELKEENYALGAQLCGSAWKVTIQTTEMDFLAAAATYHAHKHSTVTTSTITRKAAGTFREDGNGLRIKIERKDRLGQNSVQHFHNCGYISINSKANHKNCV
jgi:nitrous oxidase accessory protein NosD